MPYADSNRASLRYVKEDNWGETPANGISRALRFTSSSLQASKETVTSDEIRADRMVSSVVEVSAMSEGDINFEFSAGSQDDFLQAFLLGTWSRPMTFDAFKGNVSVGAANRVDIAGSFGSYLTVGRRIKLEGFVNPANNGYFQVGAVAVVAGVTQVTLLGAALVVEPATAATRLLDANDVVILNNTTIAADAATGAFTGVGVFASAIAAKQFVTGQKIHVTGLGYETGTITLTDQPDPNDAITVSDGESAPVTFLFGVGAARVAIGADVDATAANLATAINAARATGRLKVKASAAAGDVTVTNLNTIGGSLTEAVDGGDVITITDFAGGVAGASGFFTVVSATADALFVSPPPATVAAGAVVTIKGSLLRNPGNVDEIIPQSFSVETSFNDVNKHFRSDGLRVGSYSMEVASGSIVTGTMSFMGRETKATGGKVLGAAPFTLLDTTATEVMNATVNVGSLTKNGVELTTALQSISLEGDATLRNQMAVGSKFPKGIGTGRFVLTGTITAYFETLDLFTNFLDHDTISLGWRFTDLDSNVYFFTLPAIKITSDPITPTGIDEDVVEEMEFTAFRDAATACMLQIDRFSSILPV